MSLPGLVILDEAGLDDMGITDELDERRFEGVMGPESRLKRIEDLSAQGSVMK